MTAYLHSQLLTNTRLSQQSREMILHTTTLQTEATANNIQLTNEQTYILNRQMALQIGTTMGGTRHGQFIANCMDDQRMGMPNRPPPASNHNKNNLALRFPIRMMF